MCKTILITGGAGFIGSNVNKQLIDAGYQTLIIDNLSKGGAEGVIGGIFYHGDIGDDEMLERLFSSHPVDAVMHFAAEIDVGESVLLPEKYYINNFAKTLTLLNAMLKFGVNYFVFSSSASVYGFRQNRHGLCETDPCQPVSPYGQAKLMVENVLHDYERAYGLKSCSLRYFNAAGGDPEGVVKNHKVKEINLIPRLLKGQMAVRPITIYGNDYPTIDGTCVRDYVHVHDLGRAHIAAMEKLFEGSASHCYNLGNGRGFTVLQVIRALEEVTAKKVEVIYGGRRQGDPPVLLSNSRKAQMELGWIPRYPKIETMIEHALLALSHETALVSTLYNF